MFVTARDRSDAPRIRAVLFDAGGVLVVPDPYVLRARLAAFGAGDDIDLYIRAHYFGMRAVHEISTEFDDWQRYYRSFVGAVGVRDDRCEEAAAVCHDAYTPELWSHPLAHATKSMRALHDAGVPIGVVSNAEGQIERVLRDRGVCQIGAGDAVPVRCIVDSFVVGVAKPNPAIFDHAVAALPGDIDRAEIAFVGDSYRNDVVGATAAGLTPFQLDPFLICTEGHDSSNTHLFCTAPCSKDSDCGTGAYCVHDPQGNGCVPTQCGGAPGS